MNQNVISDKPEGGRFAFGCSNELSANDRKAVRRINVVLFAWMICYLGVLLSLSWLREEVAWLAVVAATVPLVLLAIGIVAFARFLQTADELTRKIQLDAMAIGFGAGLFVMFVYDMLSRFEVLTSEVSDPILVMVLAYTGAILIAQRRYR